MNCIFAEKVSMLIDGELSESESRQMRAHIADCTDCISLEKDFRFFREQIKESAANPVTDKVKTRISSREKQSSFWKKGIPIPVPVLTVFILLLAGLSVWLIVWRFNQTGEIAAENPIKNRPAKTENTTDDFSIARFDKGGRAEIYVAPRGER